MAPQVKLALVLSLAVTGALACASGPRMSARPPGDPMSGIDAATLEARGRSLLAAGDAIRAEQYLSAAIVRGGDADRLVPDLIALCLAGSRHRAALGYALPHLRRHPEDWALMNLVALLYLVVGEPDEAIRHAAEAARLAVDRPEPAYIQALALERLGEAKAARREYARYLALAPHGPHAAQARQAIATRRERR